MNRNQITAGLLGMTVVATLFAVAANALVKRSGTPIRIRPSPAWAPSKPDANAAWTEVPSLRLAAPPERVDIDAGVVDAARNFAIKLVTPDLKFPNSADFPVNAIRVDRLDLLNQTTGGRIEHWFVQGAVDSQNDYGIRVPSRWRILLARADDSFFPVMAQLGDFEVYRMRGHVEMLAEGRRAAWQEREAQAASQKASELAASRAVWQAIDAAKPPEEKAQAALKLAVDLLAAGRDEPARRRLQEVIDKFPGTRAAVEAAELLK